MERTSVIVNDAIVPSFIPHTIWLSVVGIHIVDSIALFPVNTDNSLL